MAFTCCALSRIVSRRPAAPGAGADCPGAPVAGAVCPAVPAGPPGAVPADVFGSRLLAQENDRRDDRDDDGQGGAADDDQPVVDPPVAAALPPAALAAVVSLAGRAGAVGAVCELAPVVVDAPEAEAC